MEKADRIPNPTETVEIIDNLLANELITDGEFRSMHHFGATLTNFRSYCNGIKSFRADSPNRKLHDALRQILDERKKEAQVSGSPGE